MFDALWDDLRYAARGLRRSPGFTAVVVLTLALGIGANTAIFTLLDAAMFKPLPVRSARELAMVYENAPLDGDAPDAVPDTLGGTGRHMRFSYPRFIRLREALGSNGSLAASTRSTRFAVRLAGHRETQIAQGQLVSGNYFSTMAVQVSPGRPLTDSDVVLDRISAVAVVSDAFWKRSMGAAADAIGQTIVVNGLQITVVGIAAPRFAGAWTDAEPDFWLPLTLQSELRYQVNSSAYANADRNQPWIRQDRIAWLNLIARIPPKENARAGLLLDAANRAGLQEFAPFFQTEGERQQVLAHKIGVEPLSSGFSGVRRRFSTGLYTLSWLVALVLLVACANVANLLLARATTRERELRVRMSLGATRGRLVRCCVTESLLLALISGVGGLVVGEWVSRSLAGATLGTTVTDIPAVFSPDARVLAFTIALSFVTVILFGLAPALRATRPDLVSGSDANQRGVIDRSPMKGMRPLVAAQFALSFVVVCASTLLGQTLIKLAAVDPGFAADHIVSAEFDPVFSRYPTDQAAALGEHLVTVARSVPGVVAAAVSNCGLLAGCASTSGFRIEDAGEGHQLNDNWVGPGYFDTVGIRLVAGREFSERDTAQAPRVAVISESIARRYFGGRDPIGKRLGIYGDLDTEIVGVAQDARSLSLRSGLTSMVYFPIDQTPRTFATPPHSLEVRVAGDPLQAFRAVQDAVHRAEPSLLLENVSAMSVLLERNLSRERLVAYLASAFGIVALFLASLGLYGVLSYTVTRRTREFGVRMALGAQPSTLSRLVLRDATRVIIAGIVLGAIAAIWTSRLIDTLLFGVSTSDPINYALVLLILMTVALAAAYLPARRAARVNPITALRAE